jgi:hypothetical protein
MIKIYCLGIVGIKGKDILENASDPECIPGFVLSIEENDTLRERIFIDGSLYCVTHVEHDPGWVSMSKGEVIRHKRLLRVCGLEAIDSFTRRMVCEEVERYCVEELNDS